MWRSCGWEGVERGGEPVPAAQAHDAVGVGGEVAEVGVDEGLLVGDGGVGAALGASADLLGDALGRVQLRAVGGQADAGRGQVGQQLGGVGAVAVPDDGARGPVDRKSTRLNSSHANISYAVFCL